MLKSYFLLSGDGGGPLVCPQGTRSGADDIYVQVGIVAWGIGCGEQIPGVYANVSQALCFIDWATR
jgi:kallikrein